MKTPKLSSRVFHPWWEWECYRSGFYASAPPEGIDDDTAALMYCEFLENDQLFYETMKRLPVEWPNSCEQFLTNPSINRIAWLGQAAMCIYSGVPSRYRVGFKLMSVDNQNKANETAGRFLTEYINEKNKRVYK